jgi:hypothetical protein
MRRSRSFLVEAFNDHPHIIVSPNARDTLQVKNADGKKVAVPKLLMQVGLGTIFSNIIKDNPTIKIRWVSVRSATSSAD